MQSLNIKIPMLSLNFIQSIPPPYYLKIIYLFWLNLQVDTRCRFNCFIPCNILSKERGPDSRVGEVYSYGLVKGGGEVEEERILVHLTSARFQLCLIYTLFNQSDAYFFKQVKLIYKLHLIS